MPGLRVKPGSAWAQYNLLSMDLLCVSIACRMGTQATPACCLRHKRFLQLKHSEMYGAANLQDLLSHAGSG